MDVGVDVFGPSLVAFFECHHRRVSVLIEYSGNRVGLGHLGSQGTSQETRLVLVEDQSNQVG